MSKFKNSVNELISRLTAAMATNHSLSYMTDFRIGTDETRDDESNLPLICARIEPGSTERYSNDMRLISQQVKVIVQNTRPSDDNPYISADGLTGIIVDFEKVHNIINADVDLNNTAIEPPAITHEFKPQGETMICEIIVTYKTLPFRPGAL